MTSLHQRLAQQVFREDYVPKQNSPGIESPMINYRQYHFNNAQVLQTDTQQQLISSPLLNTTKVQNIQTIPDQDYSFFEQLSTRNSLTSHSSPTITQQQEIIDIQTLLQIMQDQNQLKQLIKQRGFTTQQFFVDLMCHQEDLFFLMADQQAHVSVILLFSEADTQTKLRFIQLIKPNLINFALVNYASRTIQRCIQSMAGNLQLEFSMIQATNPSLLDLILSPTGNHYFLKIIEYFQTQSLQLLLDEILPLLLQVSCHSVGCCVFQKLIEHSNKDQYIQIFGEVCKVAVELVRNEFGNYVYQYILESARTQIYKLDLDFYIDQLSGFEASLTFRKASSHVVEKCIVKASAECRSKMIARIVADERVLLRMATDKFGNYVVQKILQLAQAEQKQLVKRTLERFKKELAASVYSKGILQLLL